MGIDHIDSLAGLEAPQVRFSTSQNTVLTVFTSFPESGIVQPSSFGKQEKTQ
jgi:hypothetical protein